MPLPAFDRCLGLFYSMHMVFPTSSGFSAESDLIPIDRKMPGRLCALNELI